MLLLYSFRSLFVQRTAVIPAFLSVFLSVALASGMASMIDAIERIMHVGRPDNIVILHKDTRAMQDSSFPVAQLDRLKMLPGFVKRGTTEFAGAELTAFGGVRSTTNLPRMEVPLRGVDPVAFELHDGIQLVSGSMLTPGQPGIIVGASRAAMLEEIHAAKKTRVGREMWPIIGTFSAPGTFYDFEMWGDRTALQHALNEDAFSALVGRVESPTAKADMNRILDSVRDVKAVAYTEVELEEFRSAELVPYISVAWAITLVLVISAAFASISSMHALFLKRIREFGTLLAIGFTRRQVSLMLSMESGILVIAGVLSGFLASLLVVGRTFFFRDWGINFTPKFSMNAVFVSGGIGITVIVIGLTIAMIQIRRLGVLEALRAI